MMLSCRPCHLRRCTTALLLLVVWVTTVHAQKWKPAVKAESSAELFEPVQEIAVNAVTHFPKPTRKIDDNATAIIEPTFGKHRSSQDAIFAYAEGYKLPIYMQFMETLTQTGYTGDVVMAIAEERIVSDHVVDYLKTYAQGDTNKPNLVVYQVPLFCDNPTDGNNLRRILHVGEADAFQMCQLSNVYGWKDETGKVTGTAQDPRAGRVVATLRYEWYWIWSLQYDPHTWLMLIDARDAYFQSNPFDRLPREPSTTSSKPDGLLYLFGENADATRLGKSTKNLKWIKNGYGVATLDALREKPTICSGSTMGEQIAIETYLRAMVNEHDECKIKMTGSDQGFHNYLYYSRKLTGADTIRRIVLWEQGRGVINNLGALRIKPLHDWGILDPVTNEVYQWDGKTLSPVVHQFDRDRVLFDWMVRGKQKRWERQWMEQIKQ